MEGDESYEEGRREGSELRQRDVVLYKIDEQLKENGKWKRDVTSWRRGDDPRRGRTNTMKGTRKEMGGIVCMIRRHSVGRIVEWKERLTICA